MYQQIKQLADQALALQNKDRMDAALRDISALCGHAAERQPEQHRDEQVDQQPVTATGVVGADAAEGGAE